MKNQKTNQYYWYAVYTMPQAEKKVEERFTQRGTETFLPLVKTVRVWSDRKKRIWIPLIKGYVFIYVTPSQLNDVFQIQGALGVVKHLGKPAAIKQVELDNLRILCTQPESFEAIDITCLQAGEHFEINFGLFAGLSGTLVRQAGRFRAIISIDSISKMFEVNVPISFLQKQQVKAVS